MWRSLGLGLFIAAPAWAAPTRVHHEGRVLDAAGDPLSGSMPLTFELFTSVGATSNVWIQTGPVVVSDGYYSVELGETVALNSALLSAHAELWLGVSVGSEELSRTRLLSAPYAVQASAADTISRTDCAVGDVLAWDGSTWVCQHPAVTTFTRWGRTACPATTSTAVYAGWVLSGRYTDVGAAADYLCGVADPDMSPYATSANNNGHLLWGVEFEPTGHTKINALAQREARCVVCEAQASASIMVPGAASCPSGWTEQYQGVLAGTAHTQAQQTTTICVDDNPESWGDTTNHNHGLIYAAEMERNSGMPTGYLQDQEPACVVCTK